ncbi:MAG TPA: DUF4405 domain-containing protein, partial [Myxococcales bacterium]|nr:DUF4405 domain-containing protein [Myxococcales bacterium]
MLLQEIPHRGDSENRHGKLSVFSKIKDWFEHRTGLISGANKLLHEQIPGGPRWSYVLLGGLLICFAIQAISGVLLAFHYSPSVGDAWGSVYYIQHQLTLGWMIRGLHHFGSSAMVVLMALHLVQMFIYGAYKAPREVNWLSAVLLLGLIFGATLTGNLLPWDQNGYWAVNTEINIAGGIPFVGESLQTLVRGGSDMGNSTLTGFYALHAIVLPAAMAAIMLLHVALMRRHGIAPSPCRSAEEIERTSGWFWPTQAFMNLTFGLIIVAVILALSLWVGAPLEAPSDPNSSYDARPLWHLLFLFHLLKFFEGPMVLMGTMVLPGIATLFLILLPFLDRCEDRRPAARKLWFALFFAGVFSMVGLT